LIRLVAKRKETQRNTKKHKHKHQTSNIKHEIEVVRSGGVDDRTASCERCGVRAYQPRRRRRRRRRKNVNVARLEHTSERANSANERVLLDSDKSDDDGHDV